MQAKLTIKSKDKVQNFNVRRGMGIQAICAKHATGIEYDCRKADCGICSIRVLSGAENLNPLGEREADFLKAMNADPDERLACQVRVFGDVSIEVDYL